MYHRNRNAHSSVIAGHEQVEEQNSEQESELKSKVGALKSLAIDIGVEVREHNSLLGEADDTFDSVGSLLGNTIGKVKLLAKSGHRYRFVYLLAFCIFVFLVLWLYL